MKKNFKSICAILSGAILMSSVSFTAFAAEAKDFGSVKVVVENTTFTEAVDGVEPKFTGTLLDTTAKLDYGSTMMSVIIDTLKENNISQTGAEMGWITEVGGINASDGGFMGSWMYTLNDWFTDDIADAYSVELGTLSDGDEIKLCYTLDWGADLGYDWSGTDTSLKSIDVNGGKLSPAFNPDIYEYTIFADENADAINVIPTAINKNFKVQMSDGEKEVKRSTDISSSEKSKINITCGNGENASSYSVSIVPYINYGSVRVIVENKTFTEAVDGVEPKFTGILLDTTAKLDYNSTMMSVIIDTLKENNVSQTGAEMGWITEVGGINASDGGFMGSWMYTLNDWITDDIADAYSVELGTLSDGDEIRLCYTLDWGADLGYDWSGTDTSLKDIEVIGGTLSPEFDKDVLSYEINADKDTEFITIVPSASNIAFKVQMTLADGTVIKRSTELPADEKINVSIICGNSDNNTAYTIGVVPAQKEDDNDNEDTDERTLTDYYNEAAETFLGKDFFAVSSGSSEWMVLGLSRSDKLTNEIKDKYLASLEEQLKSIDSNYLDKDYSTLNSKIIIALSALGENPADFAGYNLTEYLSNLDYISQQGLNGPLYALIAADTMGIYADKSSDVAAIVDYILNNTTDNGWALFGEKADIDMTCIAITALAPYYNTRDDVKTAIENALTRVSEIISSTSAYNCESIAQTITALCELGIDPCKDERFINDGATLLDILKTFGTDGGFTHLSGAYNQIAAEQAYYALTSYYRITEGKTPLFNMTGTYPEKSTVGESDIPSNPPTGSKADMVTFIGAAVLLTAAAVIKRRK